MALFRRPSRRQLDPDAADALAAVLATPKYELIPLRSIDDQIDLLPADATVTVTASPSKDIETTVELATRLQKAGFTAIPHIAARMITDRGHLGAVLDAVGAAGITRAFVVGGDAPEPGTYLDALSLLRDMEDLGHPFHEVGIACYPEGHPVIPSPALLRALRDKEEHASYMTTQMCFDPAAIVDWVAARRAEGITLPVHLGVPGVAELTKLVTLSARIGIGDSRRYLAKNSRLLGRLVRPGGFSADGLLDALGPHLADPDLAIEGLHLFTFNQVGATEEWRNRYLETLRQGHENEETA